MNDLELWVEGSKCYEQLNIINDMNNFGSWA